MTSENNVIKNRSELVFLYDIKDTNPNGDPMDENKPRIDEETEINLVTDVRLKRTIRDYLHNFKGEEIFVREIEYEPGKIQDAKLRIEDFLIRLPSVVEGFERPEVDAIRSEILGLLRFVANEVGTSKDDKLKRSWQHLHSLLEGLSPTSEVLGIAEFGELKRKLADVRNSVSKLKKDALTLGQMKEVTGKNVVETCVDVRLFGATIPIEKSENDKSSITLTGPVQFRFGRSLHQVEVVHIKGTGAFASGRDMEQKTFREEYVLPYSLISFYGIVNENAARTTNLTEPDITLLLDGIWNGTKNLVTRSKVGQVPRFLLRVVYTVDNYHIGDLDKKIKLVTENNEKVKNGKKLRDISEVNLNIDELIHTLTENKDKIKKIEYEVNSDVTFLVEGTPVKGSKIADKLGIAKIPVERLHLEIHKTK